MQKLLLVMRLTIILLTAALLNVSANGLSQTVRYSGKDVPLQKIFAAVEKQTGYVFLYNASVLKEAHPVTISSGSLPLETFLQLILKDQPLEYAIRSKTIIISRKAQPAATTAPPGEIRGKVVDEEGKPLMGATIQIKGTLKGTTTRADGSFVLHDIATNDEVVVSFLGHKTWQARVQQTDARMIVVMEIANDPLDIVQVIAYGNSTRRMSLGNITSVKSAEIQQQPVNNVLLALQGRVPGMQLAAINNSLPGQAPKIQIRGINSIAAGTSPLFIIDGVPIPETLPTVNGIITQSGLLTINPADVESVEVLKDAEATAIYGSRGANGVILITTKRGKAGKTKIDLNANTGYGKVAKKLPYMDVHQYNAMRREAFRNDGSTPTPQNAADLFRWDTVNVRNWQEEAIGGTAVTSDLNLSISGGDANTRFLVNGGYHKDGLVIPGDFGLDRKSIRATIDHNSPNGKFGINASAAFVNNALQLMATDLTSILNYAPSYPLNNADGTPNFNAPNGYPFSYLLQPFNNTTDNYNGHVSLRYTPLGGLNLKLNMGFNNSHVDESNIRPAASLPPSQQSSVTIRNSTLKTWIIEPQADYTVHKGLHTVTLLAGGTWQKNTSNAITSMGTGFTSDALLGNIASAATLTTSNTQSLYTYNSFFSRITYNWNQQYLVNLSFRRDGSSRFGPGKRFGNFGAAAVGWIFTEDKTIHKALPFLSFGKLRTSYGIGGNDQISDYAYITTYGAGFDQYQGSTLSPSNLANPDYRWEENRKFEAGLELGFLKDKIFFSSSLFINRTNNQLINYVLSPQTGFGGYLANFPALLQNSGWEFEVRSNNITSKNFSWKSSLNFSFSRNKLVSFPNIEQTSYSGQYFIGEPLTVRQAYRFTGLNDKGVPVFEDMDKDGSITTKDRYKVGSSNPLFGGLSNEFAYKQFRLSFFIEYTHINNFDNTIPVSRVGGLNANPLTMMLDRWQKPGDELITNRPRFTTSTATYNARNFSQSDLFWSTYNIIRLRNASISYNLPVHQFFQHLQFYILGQNLWVFDKNKYRLDPETGNGGMPPLRVITFGINCTL